jgi:ankyrin repeat protein
MNLEESWRPQEAKSHTRASIQVATHECMPGTATIVRLPRWSHYLALVGSYANTQKDHTYNYTLRQRRSDETLRGADRHKVFVQAVVEGQLPRIRNFLRMGMDLDETGFSDLTVLHRAVLSGHQDVIEPLIEAGADVNAMSDEFGTPLCLAALKGLYDSVRLLLKYKAKARIVTKEVGTALHCAAVSAGNHKATITALLNAGAHVTALATIDTQWLHKIREWDGDDRSPIGSPLQVNADILYDTTPAFVAVWLRQIGLLELLLPPDLDHVFRVGVREDINASNPSPIRTSTLGPRNGKDSPSLSFLLHTYTSGCTRNGDLIGLDHLIAKGAKTDFDDGATVNVRGKTCYTAYDAQHVRHRLVVAVDYGTTYSGDHIHNILLLPIQLLIRTDQASASARPTKPMRITSTSFGHGLARMESGRYPLA